MLSPTDENVRHIERSWGDRNPVTMDAAKAAARELLPRDARMVDTTTSRGGTPGEVYVSESLKSRFGSDAWTGGEPGNALVLYRVNPAGRVTSIIVATGNNP